MNPISSVWAANIITNKFIILLTPIYTFLRSTAATRTTRLQEAPNLCAPSVPPSAPQGAGVTVSSAEPKVFRRATSLGLVSLSGHQAERQVLSGSVGDWSE